jgi:hypothetical protein
VAPPSGSTGNTLSHTFPTNEPNTVTHGLPGTTQIPAPPTPTAPPSVTTNGLPGTTQIPVSPTLTSPPSVTTNRTPGPSLDDCINKKASCAFTATVNIYSIVPTQY